MTSVYQCNGKVNQA